MKNAAIYARVSTDDQSCERQLRDLQAFAERAGYTVVQVFTETASGMKNDRKERAKVMAMAQKRQIEAVLVTELTRWGRSSRDLINTLEDLNGFGVSVIAQTGMQFDLSTAQGKMIAGVLALMSQFERDLLSERTKSGLATARAKGKKLGRPAGNQAAKKHSKAVKAFRATGKSIRWISDELHVSKDTVMAAEAF
jgi:putative DNA-invertase from lambdoid prophage Rac